MHDILTASWGLWKHTEHRRHMFKDRTQLRRSTCVLGHNTVLVTCLPPTHLSQQDVDQWPCLVWQAGLKAPCQAECNGCLQARSHAALTADVSGDLTAHLQARDRVHARVQTMNRRASKTSRRLTLSCVHQKSLSRVTAACRITTQYAERCCCHGITATALSQTAGRDWTQGHRAI